MLLSQDYLSFPWKFGDAYFFGSYFKNYFRRFLQQINNPLIPQHKFEVHDSLDGLSDETKQKKLRQLIKELNPLQRNRLKLCIDFLCELTSYESDTSESARDKLLSLFHPRQNLSDYNVKSMVLVLEIMIQNVVALFSDQKSIEETPKRAATAIENPPIFRAMLPLPFPFQKKNQVIFPDQVLDGHPDRLRFFYCNENSIYVLGPISKSARKVSLQGY